MSDIQWIMSAKLRSWYMAYGVYMLMTRHPSYSCNAYLPKTSGRADLIELPEGAVKNVIAPD